MVDHIAAYAPLFYKDYVCSVAHINFSRPHQGRSYVIDIESLKHLEISFQPYQLVFIDCCKQFILIEFKVVMNWNHIQAAKFGESQAGMVVLTSKLTEVFI